MLRDVKGVLYRGFLKIKVSVYIFIFPQFGLDFGLELN